METKGIGQARGSTSTYTVPMPRSSVEILQLIQEEMLAPGIHSIHIEDGRPIEIKRYVDPEDMTMNRGVDQSATELLRGLSQLHEVAPLPTGAETWLYMQMQLQLLRLECAGVVVGSLERLASWLDVPSSLFMQMKPLEKTCDFIYLGIRGYVDDQLPEERIAVLGGETQSLTRASVRLGLLSNMEAAESSEQPTDPPTEYNQIKQTPALSKLLKTKIKNKK